MENFVGILRIEFIINVLSLVKDGCNHFWLSRRYRHKWNSQKSLRTVGVGTLSLTEESTEEEVAKENEEVVSQMNNVETACHPYIFLRRDGRHKKYRAHIHCANYKYDALKLKGLKTKDAKTI